MIDSQLSEQPTEGVTAVHTAVAACGVAALGLVLDVLQGRDLTVAAEPALRAELVVLSTAASRLAAERLRVVAELQRREPPRAGRDGVEGVLERDANLGRAAAHREAQLARDLCDPRLEPTRTALETGAVTPDHARVLADTARRNPAVLHGDGQDQLLRVAQRADAQALRDEVARRAEAADAHDAARRAERQFLARRLRVFRRSDGMVGIDGALHPDGGAAVQAALSALAPPDPATVPDDQRRTPEQRQADGLVRMAEATLARGDAGDDGGLEPAVVVHHQAIVLPDEVYDAPDEAELEWIGRICGASARKLACDAAQVTPVVRPDGTTVFIDERRNPTRAERRALRGRDRGCRFTWPDGSSCNEPVQWTQAHHIVFHGRGGPTVVRNLVLLCTRHHVAVHEGGWRIEGDPDGELRFIPPPEARGYWNSRAGPNSIGTSRPRDRRPPPRPEASATPRLAQPALTLAT